MNIIDWLKGLLIQKPAKVTLVEEEDFSVYAPAERFIFSFFEIKN